MAPFGNRKYVQTHWRWFVRRIVRTFLSWTILTITIIGSLLGFLPDESSHGLRSAVDYVLEHPLLWIAVVLLYAVLATLYHWPRMISIYKDRNTDIRVIIECCDILEQSGMKVIHTVDTFDSELDRIITPRSLHGAFIRRCQAQNVNLDAIIDGQLQKKKPVSEDAHLPGRTKRYELGTIIPITIGDKHYSWAAFTHMQPNGSISITKEEYIACLKNMWRNLSEPRVREEVVNVAVMGNRFVDLPVEFSTEQKIDLMIQTFFMMAREKSCCRTLRICIHPDNVADINFGTYPLIIAHLAKRPVI